MEVANASLLDEATAAAEAMTLLHRVSTKKTRAGERALFLVSDRCFPQTIDVLRSRAEPLGIEFRSVRSIATPLDARRLRRAAAVPGRERTARGSEAVHRQRPRSRCAGGRRRGPAVAGDRHAARRDGRRRRLRQLTAVRRAARLRRTPRGVLRHAACLRPPDAWPDHRRLGGRARPDGVPHGAGDARAAHPSREGDLEHLHGAGAAGQHGGDVCGLSRARRSAGHRVARAPDGAARRAVAQADGARAAQRALLRYRSHRRAVAASRTSSAKRWRPGSISAIRTIARSTSRSTKPSPQPTSSTSWTSLPPRWDGRRRTSICSSCRQACWPCTAVRSAGGASPHHAVSDPSEVQHPSLGDAR